MIRVVLGAPGLAPGDARQAGCTGSSQNRPLKVGQKGPGREDEAPGAARPIEPRLIDFRARDRSRRPPARLFFAARGHRHLAQGVGRGQIHDLLHVRLPLRHQSPSEGRRHPLYRGQPRSSGQPRGDLRQGCSGHHAAALAGEIAQAPAAGRRARLRRVPRNRMGRSDRDRGRMAGADPRHRPEKARLFYRPRPEPGPDRLLGGAVRHPQLRRAWRVLLGQHGGGRHVHLGRQLLGIRRARLGTYPLLHHVRRRRGP